jgi:transposase
MSSTTQAVAIGVGLDTARYGHHATFLRPDRQPAASPFDFLESHSGYQRLQSTLDRLAQKHKAVHFHIRVDAAGQYATNLLEFLHQLPYEKTISVGEPLRNKNYRAVHFPKRKTDGTESHACARFAIVEQPAATHRDSPELLMLQEVASRLEAQSNQSTRHVNQLHNLLARVFPELATITNDLQTAWVLKLLDRYPTAQRIAGARSLHTIANLSAKKAQQIKEAASLSVAAHRGELAEELVRQVVRVLKQSLAAEEKLEKLLIKAFDKLPDTRARQIATIKGIGKRTAAVLVAKIGSIDRFPTASQLVGYFGVFPEENQSGVDKYGNPVPPGTMRMSRKGNDLVRKYLWMAAQSAITYNPQVCRLYARRKAGGRRGDVALGHCMKKLLHQVFGIWTSGKPYDPTYGLSPDGEDSQQATEEAKVNEAESRKTGNIPVDKTVTSASPTIVANTQPPVKQEACSAAEQAPVNGSSNSINFAHVRSQITMEQVLGHLGYLDRMRGRQQRRGPCPVHGSKRDRGRTFSVHLGKNVFQCFHPPCGATGNVIDLWAAIHQLNPYEAAQHLAHTFDLQLRP